MSQSANAAAMPRVRSSAPTVLLVVILLLGLPIATWLDLKALSEDSLSRQAQEVSGIINDIRGFYASDVVGRVQTAPDGKVTTAHNYRQIPGAIPIPATLSIELGKLISSHNRDLKYRFISDLPFRGRETHPMDGFETGALAALRANAAQTIIEYSGSIFDRKVRIVTPVTLGAACVACHNSHPDSPKKDWKMGDVRGIQEITLSQPIQAHIFAFRYLLIYFACAALIGIVFIVTERRNISLIRNINKELSAANDFLASISMKIAKYLSPQVYKSIFSGQKDVTIATERKKLTIFFSDIKDFTATTEDLQPEELTALLNEYLTEMSGIALEHGATLDKFIGDAILCFFGDPETRGVAEDARACVRMAAAMQARLFQLNQEWRKRGILRPFETRMGVNTGYCNVGNFGSEDRMDYTIIGAEANLAARLQTLAPPGGIVISHETYAMVTDMVEAHAMETFVMKGITRQVVPYAVDAFHEKAAAMSRMVTEQAPGLELRIDLDNLDAEGARRARDLIERVLARAEHAAARSGRVPGAEPRPAE